MFTITKGVELTPDLLNKMINKFQQCYLPELIKRKNYYDGRQKIKTKIYSDETKPCSRGVTNFCKNITDSYNGYIASPEFITYSSNQDITDIQEILRYNDVSQADSDFLLNALIYGVSAELMYVDNKAKTRFRTIDPRTCFGVFDDTLSNDLLYFVRFYRVNEWDSSDTYWVDVYSDFDVKHYIINGFGATPEYKYEESLYFNQVPANIFYLADEKGVFDCIIDLQDTYNEILNNEVDQYSEFVDAYLTFSGVDADTDDIQKMKNQRVLLLPEGAKAEWLVKSVNDAQTENILKRLQTSIYQIASCPNFSDETFSSGVQSGIAIQFKLSGMEHRAAAIAAQMKKSLQRRIEIICGIVSLSLPEETFRDINIDMKRNIPEDINALINMINNLKGLVSDKTLLSQLNFISDIQAEIEAVKQQKLENMDTFGFGNPSPVANDEDEEAE